MTPKQQWGHTDKAKLWKFENFQSLYIRTHLIVFRYIFGLLNGPTQDVEDMTAETYMRAWTARFRFRGTEQAALGWLLRIARNLVIDSYRKGKSRGPTSNIDDHIVFNQAVGPEEQAVLKDQTNQLWERLQKLPDKQKEILVLRYFLDWRVKEIAVFLAIKENTVSVNIRRGLQHLREDWPLESDPDDA